LKKVSLKENNKFIDIDFTWNLPYSTPPSNFTLLTFLFIGQNKTILYHI
jgi:hypothetical protein